MNWYKTSQSLTLEKDPSNPDNVILYHATRRPGLISRNGIQPSNAGVIQKEGVFLVYTASTPIGAKQSLQYEEELKERMGYKVRRVGDMFIFKISVPFKDVIIKSNNDIVLKRIVSPSEIKEMIRADKS